MALKELLAHRNVLHGDDPAAGLVLGDVVNQERRVTKRQAIYCGGDRQCQVLSA
jgi:hypothetical protein